MSRSNSTTERLFRAAGITKGMSVLELGCGPGEVSILLSKIVGPSGRVLALDRSDAAIDSAKKNVAEAGINNVTFVCADLNDAPQYLAGEDHSSFDAVTGRRVLMYIAKPAQVLTGLMPWLRDGGLAVFEEADSTLSSGCIKPMPAHEEGVALLNNLLDQEGVDRAMGFNLPTTFSSAGLQFEQIWAEAVIDGQHGEYTLSQLIFMLKSRMESSGVASAAKVDELVQQIEAESEPNDVFVSGMRFCARGVKQPR